jgi:cysteine desulfurase
MDQLYLDWASTAPMDPGIIDLFNTAQSEYFGNPSSLHELGRTSRRRLEKARSDLASCLGVQADRLYFSSGGTESNAIVLLSLLRKRRKGTVLISSIEHPSVYEYIPLLQEAGYEVKVIPADESGIIRPEAVRALLDEKTRLVTVMTINNETGRIQPIDEIARELRYFEKRHEMRLHFHTDAVQAFGKIPLPLKRLGVDSASFSSHKLSGPKGVGLLYLSGSIEAALAGGGQESGLRPGTENVPSLIAFAEAALRRHGDLRESFERVKNCREILLSAIEGIPGSKVLPGRAADKEDKAACSSPAAFDQALAENRFPGAGSSPYILTFSVSPLPGEVAVRVLSDMGFAVSTGSACSSNRRKKRSRVLSACAVSPEDALASIRVSFGWNTKEQEVKRFCSVLEQKIPGLMNTVR